MSGVRRANLTTDGEVLARLRERDPDTLRGIDAWVEQMRRWRPASSNGSTVSEAVAAGWR